jgi:hypothetical protein
LPITTTSLPAWYAAIAARSPAAPVPITKTLATLLRSDRAGMLHGPCRRLRQSADPPKDPATQHAPAISERATLAQETVRPAATSEPSRCGAAIDVGGALAPSGL